LYDIMAFFIGTPDGQGGHDSLAEKIGASGKRWAKEYWRRADMAWVFAPHFADYPLYPVFSAS